ncbi:MAG: 16S rRNA (adenine(1518)-N(6)/adenine(1519)-N(6))-dimethyltransferase RsmA [Muribaculaceae bacterium]|nr:16S rRNA (adenine(1518)-N(6)/adenine(1519)-N(6))-dimethyltransferase RsmA [Muribaculaceae bacterium]
MAPVRPKKSLGQHFLTDLGVARRIAAVIDDCPGLPVVEVGPGTGVLTQFLLEAGRDLTVVELDHESVEYLQAGNVAGLKPERIVEADFLKLDLPALTDGRKMCLIGNYPYNISSQIFFKVLDCHDTVEECAGMLQREVAERICAPEGSKTRGILSVLLQVWYSCEYLFTVSEGVFNPPPKVKSGVIRLRRNDVTDPGCDFTLMRLVVKTTFGQRRKTIRNSARSLLRPGAVFPAECPLGAMRPEQLTVAQFVELTNIIAAHR